MSRSNVRKKRTPAHKAPPLALLEPARPLAFSDTESWVRANLNWFVWVIVLAGFWLRFQLAGETYFNSDETQIMMPPSQGSLAAAYRGGQNLPYGPFNNFLLYFMTFAGSSEQLFRMIAVLPGTLMAWVGYRWAAYLFGPAAGVATACILGLSPAIVNISAEVRYYMMHTFWLVCAAYCLEKAFGEQSLRWMRLFGVSLILALLTMYMSVWATAALGLYALLRIVNRELPRRLVVEWVLIQTATAAICVAAYFAVLYKFRGTGSETAAKDVWLRGSYYHPESQSVFNFVLSSTRALFVYLFANRTLGIWMVYVFAAGLVLILLTRSGAPNRHRLSALSFVMPLMATCAAAIAGFYPYGGSRHDAFLIAFVAVPVAVVASFAAREKVLIVLLAALFLAPYWYSAAQLNYLEVEPRFQKLEYMKNALDYLSKMNPRPRVLVTNEEGGQLVFYYICRARPEYDVDPAPNLRTCTCGDYKILMIRDWAADPATFPAVLAAARRIAPNQFPDPVSFFAVFAGTQVAGSVSTESRGQFGRLVVGRLSPPD